MNPTDLLLAFIQSYQEGQLVLNPGTYSWKVPTRGTPKQVWVSEVSSGGLPVCHGGTNLYGVSLLPDGFVFNANIKTDLANFAWQAVLETGNTPAG